MRDYDPYQTTPNRHAAVDARRAARAEDAATVQAQRIYEHRERRGQSPLNRNTNSSITPYGPAVPPMPRPAVIPRPMPKWEDEKARIEAKYSPRTTGITPPTSLVPTGNPNALKPGQGWQSSQYDPRGTTLLRAPDGIQERVGYGGHIASMYRPPAYNGPGESPTGIVHNNVPPPRITTASPTWQADVLKQHADIGVANSPANIAFVNAYRQHGDPQAALEAAILASKQAPAQASQAMLTGVPPIQQI